MIPHYIKEALIVSARCHQEAREKQQLIEKWMESNFGEDAVNDDRIRDIIVGSVELSNNPISAIKEIESILETDY
ncbi:hypothetical protein [Paenibacillus mesotrionivorans]|uniref:Uncharacterized protein n=1 Tax=Paenibacillus mesotrionivorans TaxID=3160968 RepID=A0ACC7NYB7_9BACL